MSTERGWRPDWAKDLTAATDPRIAKMAAAKRGRPNWARGLTAADHPGIARQAASRRGVRRGPYRCVHPGTSRALDLSPADLDPQQRRWYAYLLGLYLGDGCVTADRHGTKLEVFLDARYPSVINDCARAMRRIHPRGRAHIANKGPGCRVVRSCGRFWLRLFPQHGPGRKHERRIALADWQEVLVTERPWEFVRGLLDSDGSRFDRIVDAKAYPAYEFSNRSDDIIQILCRAATRLGLTFTFPGPTKVAFARRDVVARIDSVIPRKGQVPADGGRLLLTDEFGMALPSAANYATAAHQEH